MNLTQPRTLISLIAGALVVVILAWFMLVYRPKASQISDVEAQFETAQAEEQSLRATLAQLQSVDEDRPAEEAQVRRLAAGIPPDPELAGFILAIHDLAGRSDLGFASIAPSQPAQVPGQALSTIAVTLQVSGDFVNVVDFLDRLETMDRIVVVDALALTATEAETETAPAGAPTAASQANSQSTGQSTGSGAPGSEQVTFNLGTGTETVSVRTDTASAGQVAPSTTTTTEPRATAFLVPLAPVITRPPDRVITVAVTARLFTTATPAGAAPAAPTTPTTVAGGAGETTTTAGG